MYGRRFIEKTPLTEQLIYPRSHNYHFKSQTKGQDLRSEIQDTKSKTNDTWYRYKIYMCQIQCAWYVVHVYKVLLQYLVLVQVVFERTERNTEGRLFPVLFNNFEILAEVLPEKTIKQHTYS